MNSYHVAASLKTFQVIIEYYLTASLASFRVNKTGRYIQVLALLASKFNPGRAKAASSPPRAAAASGGQPQLRPIPGRSKGQN
jgi:hypothetical protein